MAHREQIEELTHHVNTMLTLYVEIHDGIFAHPWWRSVPIPGLFKAIPFATYEIQILKIEHILREIEGQVLALYDEATPDEQPYLATLHQYSVELLKTVIALIRVVVRLKAKTEGKPYDMSAYNTDAAAYKNAEKGYHALGEEMNREWRAYCGRRQLDEPMNKAVAESNATSQAGCEVYIHDSIRGLRVETWTVGEQVKRETYVKFKDRNGYLYVLIAYEKGEPNAMFVAKAIWDQATQQFADIDREASASFEKFKRDIGWK
jgi:hypothetical protein